MSWGRDLYIIQQKITGAVKIGRTSNIERRLTELQVGSPYEIRCVLLLPNQGKLEKILHKRMQNHQLRIAGEWFSYEGLPDLPDWIYEQLDLDVVDEWWISSSESKR